MGKQAIIIGAGPAGLTAAYELLKRTDIKPIILEKSGDIGGISKTIKYKGNRMDIGGHRFFSKSDRVMNWWLNIMPLEKTSEENVTINYQNKTHTIVNDSNQQTGEPTNPGLVMLLRKRLSRIYFLRKFFNYPIQLSIDTLRKLGLIRTIRILLSYLFAQLVPRKPEKSLEDFLINRFGRELYLLFFKDYTEKVWGVPCNEISAEWGAQRIKGVSISKAIQHAAQMMMKKKKKATGDISQKDTETSLIEQFLYPALGPGQLWEEVARQIQVLGGTILMHQNVKSIELEGDQVKSIIAVNSQTGEETVLEGDYFFSTMPVQELIAGMKGSVPTDVKEVAAGLQYRDFITVGVLLEKLSTADNQTLDLQDTWIYIQERDVKVGRLQLFNNWSPYMVNKPGTIWIGMEYFCNEGDDFWSLTDEEIKKTAVAELEKMGLAQVQHVLDSTVHRVEKTYPAYFGTYNQFDKIRAFTDQFANLFLVGRNGMHKYNNADHSMLTAMVSVDNISTGITSKENIWAINTEQEYHEEKNPEVAMLNVALPNLDVTSNSKMSFKNYVFTQQRGLLLAAIGLYVLQFVIFKFLYPFADYYFSDSTNYLMVANMNNDIGIWPIGYSKFLRLFGTIFHSDIALVGFQYFSLHLGLLYFLFTLKYHFELSKTFTLIIFFIAIVNPVFLCLGNAVSSDPIFISLCFIWITQLIWILKSPTKTNLILHGFILFILFTLRYQALYFPIISALAFFISNSRWTYKFAGLALPTLLITVFIINTKKENFKLSNQHVFSSFAGWQLANNALYMYGHVNNKLAMNEVPTKFQAIEKIVRKYFDTCAHIQLLNEHPFPGSYYLWSEQAPLKLYNAQSAILSKEDSSSRTFFRFWTQNSSLFSAYGSYLIRNYSIDFARYYLAPNLERYAVPPLEFLSVYNSGRDTVDRIAKNWFGYKSNKVTYYSKNIQSDVLAFYPILFLISNIYFLAVVLKFLATKKTRKVYPHIFKVICIVSSFWIVNLCFSVFASSVVMRYQIFNLFVLIPFSFLIVQHLMKLEKLKSSPQEIILNNKTFKYA